MAVIKTGAIFKTLRFDGTSLGMGGVLSSDYGVYITGEAVFNAPTRRVNMIQIPGRNGLFAQDEGSFDNLTVTYPAGLFGVTEADFADAISNFRNALCSRVGYKRLEDDYNPSEFRMAVYKEGLEVTPATLKAGEFTISFECKPQRWLKSGETVINAKTAPLITNPTLFDASPIFIVEGYGQITQQIDNTLTPICIVENNTYGTVLMHSQFSASYPASTQSVTRGEVLNYFDLLNEGDNIISDPVLFSYDIDTGRATINSVTISNKTETGSPGTVIGVTKTNGHAVINVLFPKQSFTKDSNPNNNQRKWVDFDVTVEFNPGSQIFSKHIRVGLTYVNNIMNYYVTGGADQGNISFAPSFSAGKINGYSTKTVADPIYIDTETGLAWYEINGEKISANNIVWFPAKIPKIPPGMSKVNTLITMTRCDMIPRWWKI